MKACIDDVLLLNEDIMAVTFARRILLDHCAKSVAQRRTLNCGKIFHAQSILHEIEVGMRNELRELIRDQ